MTSPRSILTVAALLGCAGAHAADVVVNVGGARNDEGEVGCALFSTEKGFPMDNSGAVRQWVALKDGRTTCRFTNVEPGTYAISVGHDLNGNKRVDTNFFGIPTEGWAVSRNVVPTMRAPRFDEAAFRVTGPEPVVLDLKLVY